MNNTTAVSLLINKRLVYPRASIAKGNSQAMARQLDIALMSLGFKLSDGMLKYIGGMNALTAIAHSNTIIEVCKKMVGGHVQHNTYFRDFPKNIPDTLDFWFGLLVQHFEEGGTATNNLLDFSTYGTYQHPYEEMVEAHQQFRPKKGKVALKIINLGDTLETEMINLYRYMAGSTVPLNEADREIVEQLCKAGYVDDSPIVMRENQAIINAILIEASRPIVVNSPTDILRLAAHLSGGDVTLTEKTKFRSFSRPTRRAMLQALNGCINDTRFADEVNSRREQFKRLAEKLHPFDWMGKYTKVELMCKFAARDKSDKKASKIKTLASKVEKEISQGDMVAAANLLSERPGMLVRQFDRLLRNSTGTEATKILSTLRSTSKQVAGRVLLSLSEHITNREKEVASRLFVNKAGKGYAIPNNLRPLTGANITKVQSILWKEIARRVPEVDSLYISPEMDWVAIPISEKTKSSGHKILPRGSIFELDPKKDTLRFFIYWHEASERTDYDLSAAFYNKDFEMIDQVSWTHLRDGRGNIRHSGDITSAANGASEFIDMRLDKLSSSYAYIVPTINKFAGHNYGECKECFFGFMSRDASEMGLPYEPATVQTKFDLHGDKGIALPMVFRRDGVSWDAKWIDLYLNGHIWGNRVENNKYSTALLAKTIVEREYLPMMMLADAYREKAKKVVTEIPKTPVTYIGLSQPKDLPAGSKVYTLDNLKELIPA